MGLWLDESTGTDLGLDMGQRFESAISKTLGYELYGKWVGWSGWLMVTLLFRQYDRSVLPFVFTEAQFQATCLQLRSPTKPTASFCEKMASRSAGTIVDAGGR